MEVKNIEYFELFDKNSDKINLDDYRDLKSLEKFLNKKVLRSERDKYYSYSVIDEIIDITLIQSVDKKYLIKIFFLGVQIRFQDFDNFITYARETSSKTKEEAHRNDGHKLNLCPNYYNKNTVYDSLAQTDFSSKYKQFLKDEKTFLLFK